MDNNIKKDIVQQKKDSARFRLGFILYIIALLVYPYIFLFHHFFPYTYLFGVDKSIAVAVITLVLIFSFLLQMKHIIARLGKKDFYFYILTLVLFLIARYIFYEEEIIRKLIAYRIFILPIIYAGLACYYLSDHKRRQLVIKVVFWQTLIQAGIGIFIWNFVSTGIINYKIFNLWQGGGRMEGTLFSANLFPYFILLGAFILISPYLQWRLSPFVKIVLLLLFTLSVVYSNSRWPFFIMMIVLLIGFKKMFLAKKNYFVKTFIIILVLGGLFLGNILLMPEIKTTIARVVNESLSSRLIKYKLGLSSVLENPVRGVFIGPSLIERSARTEVFRGEEIGFSDNSFITLLRSLGVFMTFLYLLFFTSIIKKNYYLIRNYLFLFFFIGALFFNNSIFFDIWLVFIFATLYSLSPP